MNLLTGGKLRPWGNLTDLRVSFPIETQCSLAEFSCWFFGETPSPTEGMVPAIKERKTKDKKHLESLVEFSLIYPGHLNNQLRLFKKCYVYLCV